MKNQFRNIFYVLFLLFFISLIGNFFINNSKIKKNNEWVIIINGCLEAKKKKFHKIITFTGKKNNNQVMKIGDINLWVNSNAYNQVETIHQMWLLSIVDLIIGKSVYSPN